MKLEEMRQKKQELGYTNAMIAEISGLPKGTVDKVMSGATSSPRRDTILALERVFTESGSLSPETEQMISDVIAEQKASLKRMPVQDLTSASIVRDAAPAHAAAAVPPEGGYTYEDYLAVPEDRRVELLDGVFYDMASPASVHQLILGRLYYVLLPCVDEHPDCELFLAPSDVRLGSDNRTVLQPDLYIRCNMEEISKTDASGKTTWLAPDFVIEILSPSSRAHDMIRKLNKYLDSGVREYWIVDPMKQTVLVYDFEHEDDYFTAYTFDDTVPVRISGGECSVDFSYIRDKVRKYL